MDQMLSANDLTQVVQAMIEEEKASGGVIGRAVMISVLENILGDKDYLNKVSQRLAREYRGSVKWFPPTT